MLPFHDYYSFHFWGLFHGSRVALLFVGLIQAAGAITKSSLFMSLPHFKRSERLFGRAGALIGHAIVGSICRDRRHPSTGWRDTHLVKRQQGSLLKTNWNSMFAFLPSKLKFFAIMR